MTAYVHLIFPLSDKHLSDFVESLANMVYVYFYDVSLMKNWDEVSAIL